MYRKLSKWIYVSHPSLGLKENTEKVEKIILELMKEYPEYLFLSPIDAFGFAYNVVDYDTGMNYCLNLLDMCDECWVFGDYKNSVGCKREMEFCKEQGIHCVVFKENENEV